MDISSTIQANSQQINADDLTGSPRTVTITNVEAGTTEQPVFIHVAEFPGRTYRPGVSMRRVLVSAWGPEASAYVGRQLTLFNDPAIRFGPDVTGGIRISHMSHIDKALTIALTVTRGKRKPFVVQPLATAAVPEDVIVEYIGALESAATLPVLQQTWEAAGKRGLTSNARIIAAKDARKVELA